MPEIAPSSHVGTRSSSGPRSLQRTVFMNAGVVGTCERRLCTTSRFPLHYVTLPALAGVEEARCRGDEPSQGFSPEAQTRCDGCPALDDPAGRDRVWANWQ